MKRLAVLTEASTVTGHQTILGCKRDVANMKKWLLSDVGGAWNPDEVHVINNVYEFEIKGLKDKMDKADYVLSSFSGHGGIVENGYGHQTQMILMGDGQEIPLERLFCEARKQVIICDACREITKLVYEKKALMESVTANFAETKSRQYYRAAFDDALKNSPDGWIYLYACSPGETTGDDEKNGGWFTDALLIQAWEFASSGRGKDILAIENAFELARAYVKTKFRTTPWKATSSRTGLYFPFAVRF